MTMLRGILAALFASFVGFPGLARAAEDGIAGAAEKFGAKSGVGGNSERLAGHIDSWIALGLVLLSLLVAWSLNHERAATRKAGTVLSGFGCLGVTIWFVAINSSGLVSDPKPAIIALDNAKPFLLWFQAVISAVAGIVLVGRGLRMAGRDERLRLDWINETERYGRLSRYLHWTTAILFLALIPMGIFTSMIPEGIWFRQGYYVVHKTIGLLVLGLLVVRIVWNSRSPRPPLDPKLKPWEGKLAHAMHRLLYLLMLAFPLTGFVMSTYGGKLSHFFIWDTPLWWGKDMGAVIPWALAHKIVLPYLAYLVIGAHVLGVVKHHFVDKKPEALRRMAG